MVSGMFACMSMFWWGGRTDWRLIIQARGPWLVDHSQGLHPDAILYRPGSLINKSQEDLNLTAQFYFNLRSFSRLYGIDWDQEKYPSIAFELRHLALSHWANEASALQVLNFTATYAEVCKSLEVRDWGGKKWGEKMTERKRREQQQVSCRQAGKTTTVGTKKEKRTRRQSPQPRVNSFMLILSLGIH